VYNVLCNFVTCSHPQVPLRSLYKTITCTCDSFICKRKIIAWACNIKVFLTCPFWALWGSIACSCVVFDRLCGYEPFHSDIEAEKFKLILKCQFSYVSADWQDISEAAKVCLLA